MSDAEPPVLDGYVTEDGVHSCVWCRYCLRWHQHGHTGGPIGAGNGHRVAHCAHDSASLYLDTGYVIREVGYITVDQLRRKREFEGKP